MYQYYPHDLGFIDVQFRDGTWNLFDPDQDASFYVEVYDADDVLRHTLTLGSTPPIEKISTGKFMVQDIPLTDFEFGVAYYRWYAKQAGTPLNMYPVFEFCFQVLESVADSLLCTLADVKTHLQIESTKHDAWLNKLIVRASAFIAGYCGRVFPSTLHTEYYTGDGTNTLVLDQAPVTAITSIEDAHGNSGVSYAAGDEHVDWELDGGPGILMLLRAVFGTWPPKTWKIVYTAGYATAPEVVIQACIEIVADKFYLKERQKSGVMSETFGGKTVQYRDDDLSPAQKRMLAQFRRRRHRAV